MTDFTPGVPSNALTSVLAKGVCGDLRAKGHDVPHTEVLNAMAKALGFHSANAMRALAETGEDPRGSLPPRHAHYFRTRYVIDVLSTGEAEDGYTLASLGELAELISEEGEAVGHLRAVHVTPLNEPEMDQALAAAGAPRMAPRDADQSTWFVPGSTAPTASTARIEKEVHLSAQDIAHHTRVLLALGCNFTPNRLHGRPHPSHDPRRPIIDARSLFTWCGLSHVKASRLDDRLDDRRHAPLRTFLEFTDPDNRLGETSYIGALEGLHDLMKRFHATTPIPEVLARTHAGIEGVLATQNVPATDARSLSRALLRMGTRLLQAMTASSLPPLLRDLRDRFADSPETFLQDAGVSADASVTVESVNAALDLLCVHIGADASLYHLLAHEGVDLAAQGISEPDFGRPPLETGA
ncbi:hypothetical protein CKO28_01250 [Rhodovibrio sodomensis]|uniref:Uncharacterized protein n=1 Tax=Rhodovibrio sodomensis TaxID=1088 RepID=A0ABS1D8G9_9PROT|nr:hypothetical protein [Rhodovibrio sodomensis]MBK1666670.1 hypothetical protein [Rhodovibrio sodomensis]